MISPRPVYLVARDQRLLALDDTWRRERAQLPEDLNGSFHRQRQSGIDEELFDVISGSEALADGGKPPGRGVAES